MDTILEPALDDVVLDELEAFVADQVGDVEHRAGAEVVDAQHVVATVDETITQVGAEEAGASGDNGRESAHDRPTP